ncbi:MAG: AraC family transcriptional regulator [Clostridiales bacterium]|nr:AraC family transcriptional regulator [Clostridiales bacterium]
MINIKHIHKKHGVIFNWFLSYMIILIIPTLIIGISNIATINIVEEEINKSDLFILKRVQNNIDNLLYNAQQLSNEICFNDNIQKILTYNKSSNINYYIIHKAVEDLRSYKDSTDLINNYYIYFKDIDIVISPDGSTDEKTFYKSYYEDSKKFSYNTWHETNRGYYAQRCVLLKNPNNDYMTFLYGRSLPLLEKSSPMASIFVMLDDSMFARQIDNANIIGNDIIFVTDKNDNVIYSSNKNADLKSFGLKTSDKPNGLFRKKINGHSFVVSYINSRYFGFRYIIAVPYADFWQKAQYVKKYALISFLLCLSIGGIVTALLIIKNYNPIRKLVKSLEPLSSSTYASSSDEYSFIKNALSSISNNKQDIEKKLESQNKVLKCELIRNILKGRFENEYIINEYLSICGINFDTQYFLVILLYINDAKKDDLKGCSKLNLRDKIKKVLEGRYNVYFTEDDNMNICLINFKEEPADGSVKDIVDEISKIQGYIAGNYKINFSLSAGNIHDGIYGISKSYNESAEAMDYKMVMRIEGSLCYSDIQKLPENNTKCSFKKELNLINQMIESGNIESALDELFNSLFMNRHFSLEMSKCFKMNIMSTLTKIVNDMDNIESRKYVNLISNIEQIMECESKDEIKQKIIYIIDSVRKYVNCKKDRHKKSDLQNKIIKYIAKNYNDPDLNVSAVAEHLGMHPVYISQAFKEQSGQSILDYIHKIRIEKAKEILKCPENTIEKAANDVGYANVRTFIRVFKKYEGINPGLYKDIMRDK